MLCERSHWGGRGGGGLGLSPRLLRLAGASPLLRPHPGAYSSSIALKSGRAGPRQYFLQVGDVEKESDYDRLLDNLPMVLASGAQ